MLGNLRFFIYILAVFLFCLSSQATKIHPVVKANLQELMKLDSIIEKQPELNNQKEMSIGALRASLSRVNDIDEQIPLANRLFEEYRYYDTDSALKYSRLVHELAEKQLPRNDSLLVISLIDQAHIYSIQGYHAKAAEILAQIPPEALDNTEISLKYYKAKEYGASMELVYANDNKENVDKVWKNLLQYRKSLSDICKNMPDRYLWMPIAEKLEGGDVREVDPQALEKLRLSVDTISETARIDAPSAYWLARYYKVIGDSIKMIHYLAKASQIKILNQYRENPAMPELAEELFGYGDIDRAFNYIMYSGNQINAYKNRNRIVMVTSIISTVRDAYNTKLNQRDRMLRRYIIAIITFSVVLVCVVVALINRNKKLNKTRDKLSKVNSELVEALGQRDGAISSLSTANEKLRQLNKMKHEVIALAFHLAAIQIGRLNEYRKKLLRKYKTNQLSDLGSSLNDDEIIKDYYADLNKAFDKTVVSTFPDFIEDYNKSCGEDSTVDIETIKKTQTLNVRLRIYALRRLGIEKSADLAQILNVSIRTVYNNRSTDPKNP